MAEPILDLSTLAPERQTVQIKTKKNPTGKLYEMRVPDELSLTDQQWFVSRAESLYRFGIDAEETPEAQLVLDQALEKIMVDLPAEVAEQLPRPQRWRMVAVFLMPFVDKLMPIMESTKGTRFEGLVKSLPTGES